MKTQVQNRNIDKQNMNVDTYAFVRQETQSPKNIAIRKCSKFSSNPNEICPECTMFYAFKLPRFLNFPPTRKILPSKM